VGSKKIFYSINLFFLFLSFSRGEDFVDSTIEEHATAVIVGDVVSVLDHLNKEDNIIDCYPNGFSLKPVEGYTLSCSALKEDAQKQYEKSGLFLKSRAVRNITNSESTISGRDFLLYDLFYRDSEGNEKKIGTCLDEKKSFFGRLGEENSNSAPSNMLTGIRITDHWRVPLSIEVDEEKIRDEKGEKVSLLDFSLSTGVNYELFRGERSNVTLMPTVDIPLLQDVSGPMDVLDRDNFRGSNFIPNKIGFKVQVNF